MKKIKTILFLIFAITSFINNAWGQIDSAKRKTNFIVGINGGINNTYLFYTFGQDNGSNASNKGQKLSFGGEGEFFLGIKKQKFQATLGFGYACNTIKIAGTSTSYGYISSGYNNFYYKFYDISVNANWLVGIKKSWIVGANVKVGILQYYKEFYHLDYTNTLNNTSISNNIRYEYLTPQKTIWAGINFGKLFKINNATDFSIIFNTKASSLILGKGANKQKTTTHDAVLFVKTLNINLNFKL